MTLKPNTHLRKPSGLCNGDAGFWGERVRGSLNNKLWDNQLTKALRAEKRAKKVKSGVVLSVLTSSNTEAVVS